MQVTNNFRAEDMTRHVSFPDVDPNELPEDSLFTMTAGDFLEVYADVEYAGAFDCVATSFFIDCAHNINDFIELIHREAPTRKNNLLGKWKSQKKGLIVGLRLGQILPLPEATDEFVLLETSPPAHNRRFYRFCNTFSPLGISYSYTEF